jgi:hypothetical protein
VATIYRGDSQVISVTFTDQAGQPAVLAEVTFTASGPDGVGAQSATLTAGTVQSPQPGVYQAPILFSTGGTWNWRMDGGAGYAEEGQIEVAYRRWTYGGNPSTSPADATRFLLGDTDPSDPQTDDGEVAFALATYGSPRLAAAFLAETLAAVAARQVNIFVGSIRIFAGEKVQNLRTLAANLRSMEDDLRRAEQTGGIMPVLAGVDQVERVGLLYDIERRPMLFDPDRRKMPFSDDEMWATLNPSLFQ